MNEGRKDEERKNEEWMKGKIKEWRGNEKSQIEE